MLREQNAGGKSSGTTGSSAARIVGSTAGAEIGSSAGAAEGCVCMLKQDDTPTTCIETVLAMASIMVLLLWLGDTAFSFLIVFLLTGDCGFSLIKQ